MRGAAEILAFLGLSAAVHAGVLLWPQDGTGAGAGEGGESTISLPARAAQVAPLVTVWQTAPEVLRDAPPEREAPMEPATFRPPTPRGSADLPETPPAPERPSPVAAIPPRAAAPAAPLPPPERPEIAEQSLFSASPTLPGPSLAPTLPLALSDAPPARAAPSAPDAPPPLSPIEPSRREAAASAQAVATSPRPTVRPDRPAPPPQAAAPAPAAPTPPRAAEGSGGGATAGAAATPAPQQTGLSSAARQSLMASWASRIQGRIERARPRVQGAGSVLLRLTITRDGRLASVGLARSSGDARVDQAAIQAVQRAGRFPAAPDGLTDASYAFSLPITFR